MAVGGACAFCFSGDSSRTIAALPTFKASSCTSSANCLLVVVKVIVSLFPSLSMRASSKISRYGRERFKIHLGINLSEWPPNDFNSSYKRLFKTEKPLSLLKKLNGNRFTSSPYLDTFRSLKQHN